MYRANVLFCVDARLPAIDVEKGQGRRNLPSHFPFHGMLYAASKAAYHPLKVFCTWRQTAMVFCWGARGHGGAEFCRVTGGGSTGPLLEMVAGNIEATQNPTKIQRNKLTEC